MLLKTPVARACGSPLPALLPIHEALARGDVPQNCSLLSTSGDACLLRCDADNSLRKAACGPIAHLVDAAANCFFDRGADVDFIPCHHLLESAFGFVAAALKASIKTVGSICHETPPFALAPAAGTFLSTIADARIPIFVGPRSYLQTTIIRTDRLLGVSLVGVPTTGNGVAHSCHIEMSRLN